MTSDQKCFANWKHSNVQGTNDSSHCEAKTFTNKRCTNNELIIAGQITSILLTDVKSLTKNFKLPLAKNNWNKKI